MVQRIHSPNGIEAWLVEDYAVPIVAVDFAFRGGAAQDPPERPGLGQMMTSLLDEGAGPLDDQAFQLRIEENAVELSFHAGRDYMAGSLRTLAGGRAEAFDLTRLAVTVPRFDPDPVERIRQGMLANLRREASDPHSIASRAFTAALYPGHPYGSWPHGTLESIGAASREEIAVHHARLFARDNLVVSIVGAITAADAAAMLDTVFAALPARAGLSPVAEVAPAVATDRRLIDLDVPQTVLQLATPGVKRSDPDYMAAYIANHILGGGSFSSRLFQKVREEKGLAYSVSTQLACFQHSAYVAGGVATSNDRAAESLAIIEAEMAEMAAQGPTADELENAKSYITGSYALRFDTSAKIANQLTHIQLEGLGSDYIERRNALVEAVTPEEVRAAGRRLFGEGKPFVTAVGRPERL
ncbi:M16 family metallopeptidase [Labrys wisconsinensis]|uniref:Zinc protease n=1 Tax=Labrys wisconsinensis TaxID=425677 RepID=A0ABU0JMT2_9HYPH|nr:pitrilysin family protein [Labrys wisconsinensis]MDQ0474960.1 zinc protease [Labrys wisconsinensis]